MKIVREFLYEKFTEDSDPIRDLGIGLLSQLEKKYRWMYLSDPKDHMRIRDIIFKAGGNPDKEVRLAKTMCKLITDPSKAYRRYLAAKEIGGPNWEVTHIFLERSFELNKIS